MLLFASEKAFATEEDFFDYFEVDLEKDVLPSLDDLKKMNKDGANYNKKFKSLFDLTGDFDNEFFVKAIGYGMQEKRIKAFNEDSLIDLFKRLPEKYYQYFGPMLFEVPGFPKKILNLPAIKKTKNQFPKRIAKQLEGIDNLEFLSPSLYHILMPEVWPDYEEKIEKPKMRRFASKYVYDKKFYEKLAKIVKPDDFGVGKKEVKSVSKSDLRTLNVKKDSLITAADITAFAETIDEVNDWANTQENIYLFSTTSVLLFGYEKNDRIGKYVPQGLTDMANPCARFVQKARILGKDKEIARMVAKKGMRLNEWAYICDKSIKAYRVANINIATVQSLRMYKKGFLAHQLAGESVGFQNHVQALIAFAFYIHKAPLRDVLEYRKVKKLFDEKMKKAKFELFGHPVLRL